MTDAFPSRGRLAGIDFGTVRIGIAISDPERRLASPHANYTRAGPDADARYFRQLVEEEQIVAFVVGLPVHASGEESQKSLQCRRFGQWLRSVTGLPVRFFDERYTSVQAERSLIAAQMTRKKRKKRRDMVAAQLILAAYLDSPSSAAPGPLDD